MISLAGKRMKPFDLAGCVADRWNRLHSVYQGVLIVGNSHVLVRRKPTPIHVYFRHAHDNGVEEAEDVLVSKEPQAHSKKRCVSSECCTVC